MFRVRLNYWEVLPCVCPQSGLPLHSADVLKFDACCTEWLSPFFPTSTHTRAHIHTQGNGIGASHICFHLNLPRVPDVLAHGPGDVELFESPARGPVLSSSLPIRAV